MLRAVSREGFVHASTLARLVGFSPYTKTTSQTNATQVKNGCICLQKKQNQYQLPNLTILMFDQLHRSENECYNGWSR